MKNEINTIVLCAVDTLRRDKLGFYGCSYNTTPFLDTLAAKSIIFDNAWTVSNKTDPSFTTIMTGLTPEQHGIIHHAGEIKEEELSKVYRLPTIATELQKAGWQTIGMDWLERWHSRGFDYYMGLEKSKEKTMHIIEWIRQRLGIQPGTIFQKLLEKTPLYNFFLRRIFKHQKPPYKRAEDLINSIPRLKEKTFLFLHFWDCHIPYWPPKEFIKPDITNITLLSKIRPTIKQPLRRFFFDCMMFDKKTVGDCINAYHGCIRYVDYAIKKLCNRLDMDKTLFFFTADHGESLTEDGIYFTHEGNNDCVMRIPMFVWYPDCSPQRIKDKIDLTYIKPFILKEAK